MAFVNEYGTEEDIEKYRLKEAWVRFDPTRDPPFHGRRPELTVDRDNGNFLMVRGSFVLRSIWLHRTC